MVGFEIDVWISSMMDMLVVLVLLVLVVVHCAMSLFMASRVASHDTFDEGGLNGDEDDAFTSLIFSLSLTGGSSTVLYVYLYSDCGDCITTDMVMGGVDPKSSPLRFMVCGFAVC